MSYNQSHVDAPVARSSEITALLAQRNLFIAEMHPAQASLEEIFLELTAAPEGTHRGMAALMELYKIRRRLMSKALLGFGLLFMIGIFFLFGLFTWSDANRAASSFQPPSPTRLQFLL